MAAEVATLLHAIQMCLRLGGGKIVVSHLDLDTVGGIMAVAGDKIEDASFWQAAEYIDVNGPQHMHTLSQDIQDKLNAMYAWNATQERVRYTEPTDVTDKVKDNYAILEKILDERHPEHDAVIKAGQDWKAETTAAVESKLAFESSAVRAFKTDGVFCSSSYYSPNMDCVADATVVYNEKFKSVTVAFEDGGKDGKSAKDIVQSLWGDGAGGRDGIAGSPRGQEMTEQDWLRAVARTEQTVVATQIAHDIIEHIDNLANYNVMPGWRAEDMLVDNLNTGLAFDRYTVDMHHAKDADDNGIEKVDGILVDGNENSLWDTDPVVVKFPPEMQAEIAQHLSPYVAREVVGNIQYYMDAAKEYYSSETYADAALENAIMEDSGAYGMSVEMMFDKDGNMTGISITNRNDGADGHTDVYPFNDADYEAMNRQYADFENEFDNMGINHDEEEYYEDEDVYDEEYHDEDGYYDYEDYDPEL